MTLLLATQNDSWATDIFGSVPDNIHYYKITGAGEIKEIFSPTSSAEYDLMWYEGASGTRSDSFYVGGMNDTLDDDWLGTGSYCIYVSGAGNVSGGIGGDFIQNSNEGWGGIILNEGYIAAIGGSDERQSLFLGNKSSMAGMICNTGRIGSVELDEKSEIAKTAGGIQYASFIGNATGENGSAIRNVNYTTPAIIGQIVGSEFISNRAAGHGGAIYNGGSAIIGQIKGGVFKDNVSDAGGGGAICNEGKIGLIELSGGFVGNQSRLDGGAISNYGSIASIRVDNFENNASVFPSRGGGAIHNEGEIGSISIRSLIGNSTGEDNDANTSGGGGIVNYGAIGDVAIDKAEKNYAWRHNGGVILNWLGDSGEITRATLGVISGQSFSYNYAFGSGGAIHNEGEGAVIAGIEVKLFSYNISLSSGGAIRNYKGAKLTSGELHSTFVGNYAWNRAGALYYEGKLREITGCYEGNESYNDGGAICFAEDGSLIEELRANFLQNRAGINKVKDENGEWKEDAGLQPAVGNGGAILNGFVYIDVNLDMEGQRSALHEWLLAHRAEEEDGHVYYKLDTDGSRISKVVLSQFIGNSAGYDENGSPHPGTGLGSGGAICNGYIDHLVNNDTDPFDFWIIAPGEIGEISESEFRGNAANYRGGAIYNARGSIGRITDSRFVDNKAYRSEGDGYGGAIFNNKTTSIGSISGSQFTGNVAGAAGGAIYNEVDAQIGGISESSFENNRSVSGGSAIHNLGQIGSAPSLASGAREFDGTIEDGVVNTFFRGNIASDAGTANAAVYTETLLSFVAQSGNEIVFSDNAVGESGLTRDLYVAPGATGSMPDIYMVAEGAGSITTHGEILGQAGFVLRLRGHSEQAEEKQHAASGSVTFNGLVINADVIMDDVTLKLGTAKATDYGRYSDEEKPYVAVYDDTLPHNENGELLIPTDKPGGVEIDGSKGDVAVLPPSLEPRAYSDVLRMSRLEARSGQVHTADSKIVNYNIGSIVSNGRMSYGIEGAGYYDDKSIYATWAIDINLDTLKADTFTTWYREGDAMAQSRGYLTLSGLNILATTESTIDFDGHEQHDHAGDSSTLVPEDQYPSIRDYYDVTIQVINLIKQDQQGKETATPASWTKEGDIHTGSPLQLDLGELRSKPIEASYMNSNDLLCEGIGYGDTKTYHDSIRVWGWRDHLAAWSEWAESGDPREMGKEYGKEFEVIGGQTLTRNIKRGADGRLLQEDGLMIHGSVAGVASVLNVNGFNLLSEVAAGQTLELRYLTIQHVGTADDPLRTGSVWNRISVEGSLILDTLAVDRELTVVNDSEVIRRGDWDIYYTFTSRQSGPVAKGDNGVTNVLRLQEGRAEITGTVEHQNIINETSGAHTILVVNDGADHLDTQTWAYTPWQGGETGQFCRFADNSLTMGAGRFDLWNLNQSELILRDFNVYGGRLNVNSVTVDLSAPAEIAKVPGAAVQGWQEGHMGMIWATESADQNLEGQIWVEKVVLRPVDGKEMRIPVQFVNPEVGASVVPFNDPDDYGTPNEADNGHRVSKTYADQHGAKYMYTVHYDYDMGQYIYERMVGSSGEPVFTPAAQVGAVAEQAGAFASMEQMHEHVFEHADLYSASVLHSQKKRAYDRAYTVVETTKGKESVVNATDADECSGSVSSRGGMWVRPYAAYEKLPLKNGPEVSNSLYGAVVGADSPLKEHRNSWASVFSVHAAYMGSTQCYSQRGASARASQNGGGVGVTGTFYHRNFYTALSGTVATSAGREHTLSGAANFRTLMAGVASRSGVNIELGRGAYVLQPTLLATFTSINMADYTDASGVRFTSDPLQVIQLHPYVKFIVNTPRCWQIYSTLGYVHNLMGQTKMRADDARLPEVSIDPYLEYSVGVQKTWADKYTFFGQATGRHGGRNGAELSTGIRRAW